MTSAKIGAPQNKFIHIVDGEFIQLPLFHISSKTDERKTFNGRLIRKGIQFAKSYFTFRFLLSKN